MDQTPPLHILYWGVLALFTYAVLSALFRSLQRARRARQLGCKAPPHLPMPAWDRWLRVGITVIRKNIAVSAAKEMPQWAAARNDMMSALLGRPAYTYQFPVVGHSVVFTCDPKNLQAVLATQFHDFQLGPARFKFMEPLLGSGIFTTDGHKWERSRAMLRPSFARERVSSLELEEHHNQNLLRAIPVRSDDGWTDEVDLQVLFFRLTIDSATEFLFGESVASQLHEMEQGAHSDMEEARHDARKEANFARAFDQAQAWIMRRFRFGLLYRLQDGKEFRQHCRTCHEFIDRYVQLALRKDCTGEDGLGRGMSSSKSDSKEKYVFLEELAQQTRHPTELRSQLLNILLAGRDTTASLLGWLFFILARNPSRYKQLREVVIEDFGPADAPKCITFAKLKACKTLQHYLDETLRLFPVVPGNGRIAVKDTTLPRGGGSDGSAPVFIKKGTNVVYSVYVLHRHKDLWGKDADVFRPERFDGRKHGFDYLPFNAGPRLCLGQQFALTSAAYTTVKLLQKFDDIENMDMEPTAKQNMTLTSCSARGVRVKLHKAQI